MLRSVEELGVLEIPILDANINVSCNVSGLSVQMVACLIYSKISEELNVIFMAIDMNYEMQILAYSKIDCLFSKEKK